MWCTRPTCPGRLFLGFRPLNTMTSPGRACRFSFTFTPSWTIVTELRVTRTPMPESTYPTKPEQSNTILSTLDLYRNPKYFSARTIA